MTRLKKRSLSFLKAALACFVACLSPLLNAQTLVFSIDEIPDPISNFTPYGNWSQSWSGTFQGYFTQSFQLEQDSEIGEVEMYLLATSSPRQAKVSIRTSLDGGAGDIVAEKVFSVGTTSGWQRAVFDTPVALVANSQYFLRLEDLDSPTTTPTHQFIGVAAHYNQSSPQVYSGGQAYINTSSNSNSDINLRLYTATPPTVPDAPTIGTATAGDAQATVAFTAPTSTGGSPITSYTATSTPGSLTGACSDSPCTVTGLTNGTAYTFTVVATNALGDSAASGASNSVTPATVPNAPTIGTATAGDAQATVAFTAPTSTGGLAITGYTATSTPGSLTGACSDSPCTVTGLTNGTAYTFKVVATNAVGDSAASSASNSVTPATVPDAPTIGTATAGDAQATVAFTAPTGTGGAPITGYTATSTPGSLTGACSDSPCTVTGLTNGTAYTFKVVATNAVGDSAASAASNSVTPDSDSDSDGDGTPDTQDAFPKDPIEDLDSDGDGIGDNGDAGGTGIGIRVTSASTLSSCEFSGPVTQSSTSLDNAPGTPLDVQLEFTLVGCGDSVTIEALFGDFLPDGSVAYKVTGSGDWIPIEGATVSGNSIRYTVTDGGPLDEDGLKDGRIIDPVTAVVPALSAPAAPIPTLPFYGLLALGGLLGLFGIRRLKA